MITKTKDKLSIFLVDDQEISNFINKKLIEVTGMCEKVFDYTNPEKALQLLEKHNPNLIFLDLNMPEINGWNFLEKMENYNSNADVVIVTSSTSALDVQKSKKYNRVKEYFVKPLYLSINNLFR